MRPRPKPRTSTGPNRISSGSSGRELLLLFIVGDILGTGVYALTGSVAGEVGGAAWAPFLVAFIVATITAFSYLELVTKYPQAAGAALYTHKAFGIHFFTFLVAFAVMCSGITSASTASNAFAGLHQRRLHARPRGRRHRADADRAGVHDARRPAQPPWRQRERQGQRRDDAGRAVRPAADHLHRHVRRHPGQRGLLAGGRVRQPERQGRLLRGHRSDVAGVLRHGRLRGLGQHGRGVQGPGPRLPEDDAHRPRDHRS